MMDETLRIDETLRKQIIRDMEGVSLPPEEEDGLTHLIFEETYDPKTGKMIERRLINIEVP